MRRVSQSVIQSSSVQRIYISIYIKRSWTTVYMEKKKTATASSNWLHIHSNSFHFKIPHPVWVTYHSAMQRGKPAVMSKWCSNTRIDSYTRCTVFSWGKKNTRPRTNWWRPPPLCVSHSLSIESILQTERQTCEIISVHSQPAVRALQSICCHRS